MLDERGGDYFDYEDEVFEKFIAQIIGSLVGEEITNNLLQLDEINERLTTNDTIEVRGEVIGESDGSVILNASKINSIIKTNNLFHLQVLDLQHYTKYQLQVSRKIRPQFLSNQLPKQVRDDKYYLPLFTLCRYSHCVE